jgi:tRNA(Ser,Leu) C12 N-acetylase TAN1
MLTVEVIVATCLEQPPWLREVLQKSTFADCVRNVVPIHIRSKVGGDSSKDDLDIAARQRLHRAAPLSN